MNKFLRESFMNDAKLLLAVLTPVMGFVVAFYMLQSDVRYQAEKIQALEKENQIIEGKINEMYVKFTDIQITLAEIKKDLSYIKSKVN